MHRLRVVDRSVRGQGLRRAHADADGLAAGRARKVGLRRAVRAEIGASQRELWVRRVGDEYVLVVVLAPGVRSRRVTHALALRAGVSRRSRVRRTGVGSRASDCLDARAAAVGWPYAPDGLRGKAGARDDQRRARALDRAERQRATRSSASACARAKDRSLHSCTIRTRTAGASRVTPSMRMRAADFATVRQV